MRWPLLLLLTCLALAAGGCRFDQSARTAKTQLPSPWQTVQKATVTAETGIYTAR